MRLYGCGYNYDSQKPGIWLFDVESELVGESVGAENPSYGVIRKLADGQRLLYAACEVEDCAELSRFDIDGSGVQKFSESRTFEGAAGTCFVLLDPDGKCAYGADYNSGSICGCALNADGSFGESWPLVQHYGHGLARPEQDPNFDRQLSAHVHTLSFIPGTPLLAAVDLGLDRIFIYEPQSDGKITDSDLVAKVVVPEGCGPRIVAYHPTFPIACVVCELSCEAMIYQFDESGTKWNLIERHGLIDGHAAD